MKYPRALMSDLAEVEGIVSAWPTSTRIDDVIRWIVQFDSSDQELAIRILRNLNVLGADDLNSALSIAYSKLMRKSVERNARITSKNTLFAGVGSAGKSGSMLGYHFRLINDLSEENFLSEETEHHLAKGRIDNIVLVDDVVSSGRQAAQAIRELTEKVTPLGVKNIFLLTICGFRSGIAHVESETKAHTFSAFEYGPEDTLTSLDAPFYDGVPHDQRSRLFERLQYYGGQCAPKSPLGYGGLGALLVFFYNTPNSTTPLVWSDMNEWIPLFRRVRRINGITSYYSQFDRQAEAAASKAPKRAELAASELTLFVEGKVDELFFDRLVAKYNLAKRLGVKSVSVVALGSGIPPARLFHKLALASYPAVFVPDADEHSKRFFERNATNYTEMPIVRMKPNIFGFTKETRAPEPASSDTAPATVPEDQAYALVERRIRTHWAASALEPRIREMVDSMLDDVKVEAFIGELRVAIVGAYGSGRKVANGTEGAHREQPSTTDQRQT